MLATPQSLDFQCFTPSASSHELWSFCSLCRQLLRQCFPQSVDGAIHCYEMFLMHVGLVTPPFIASHCQRLAHKLWEMSGEAYTPVNLLWHPTHIRIATLHCSFPESGSQTVVCGADLHPSTYSVLPYTPGLSCFITPSQRLAPRVWDVG